LSGLNGIELEQEALVASGSILHEPTGLFVTLAGGRVEYGDFELNGNTVDFGVQLEDAKYFFGKAGIYRKFLPIGKTSIYGEYYTAWDIGPDASNSPSLVFFRPTDDFLEQSHMVGFGVVQHIDSAAMEIYAAYRHYWADDLTDFFLLDANGLETDFDVEMDAVMTGARIKF
ncbi:MAG: hypothetical protein AAFR75_13790, partial [Pseudomonadota bacterium]